MQLIGTGSQRAGKASQVLILGVPLSFASWNADVSAADLPTPNFESYDLATDTLFDEGLNAVLTCNVTFGGDWDAGLNPLDEPPGLYPRDDLATVVFMVNQTDATNWAFPYVRLRSAKSAAAVGSLVTFECGGKNQGSFTYPTGSV